MNRKQRVAMIVKLLLLPFTREPFQQKDLLLEKAVAYQKLLISDNLSMEENLAAWERVRKRLIASIEDEIKPDKLSEMSELLEMFYPERTLAQIAVQTEARNRRGGLESYYFDVILRLAVEFVALRDGRVSLKLWEDNLKRSSNFFPQSSGLYKVELWSEIARTVTPDLFIAGYFVRTGIRDPGQLKNLPDHVFLSDSLMARINAQGIAETHLHFSAGMSYLSVWEAVTDPAALRITSARSLFQQHQKEELREHRCLILAGWLRLMMAKYLQITHQAQLQREKCADMPEFFFFDLRKEQDYLEHSILRYVLGNREEAGNMQELLRILERKNERCLSILYSDYQVSHAHKALDVLMRGLYASYAYLGTSPELLLLFFALHHIQSYPEHNGFQKVFLCYLRIKNQYFSNKLQATGMGGLTFFRRYFASAASAIYHRGGEDLQKSRLAFRASIRNQFHCDSLKKLEMKISPPFLPSSAFSDSQESVFPVARQLSELFLAYREVLEEFFPQGKDHQDAPTPGFVYHLIRHNIQRSPVSMCWAVSTPNGPDDRISHVRRQCNHFLSTLQFLRQSVPLLSEYVVGLDVASEEIETEPWIYAPVYHHARSRETTVPIQIDSGREIQNIGFTYHVGEDYHHILSGLRHIDEILTHFGYKPGDRIGHGLALQIDIQEWMSNNEVVSLPIVEHLENLVWLWSLCSQNTTELSTHLPVLEREILSLAEELYGNLRGITPYMLWRAYTRKFLPLESSFCEEMKKRYFSEQPSQNWNGYLSQRTFCSQVKGCEANKENDFIWDADKLLLTHYCPVYMQRYQEPYFTANGREKLALFSTVQKIMRNKVEQMGIFVEVNPTSNMIIGDIRGLSEYPITELNAPDFSSQKNFILVSINSDDPLVFSTNVENELALMYHTLTYRGYSREKVLFWIDKVRQYGMNSSFIRQVKPADQQKQELEKMITELKNLIERL